MASFVGNIFVWFLARRIGEVALWAVYDERYPDSLLLVDLFLVQFYL